MKRLKTLDRVLSKAGLGSRTDARKWIGTGRVTVNGRVIQTPDHWVDIDNDRVTFDGKDVRAQKTLYLLLYKPTGYITTYRDPEGRPTVYDLMANIEQWVSPVGRLDQDTSGLLIMTNDNQFANRVMSPEFKIPKTYLVKASPVLPDSALDRLRGGVDLSDGPTAPADVRRDRDSASSTFLEITITEGRNRQVRRMIEAVGGSVRKLVRVAIGAVRIGNLQIGHWRVLTPEEVSALGGGSEVRPSRAYGTKGKASGYSRDRKPRHPRRQV